MVYDHNDSISGERKSKLNAKVQEMLTGGLSSIK
jgi:hypothetical protein